MRFELTNPIRADYLQGSAGYKNSVEGSERTSLSSGCFIHTHTYDTEICYTTATHPLLFFKFTFLW